MPAHRPDRDPGRLSSVSTAIRLMKAFSEEQFEIGISDMAKRLGVAKSTVHRLAVTLVADGMLEQNPDTGKYRLGIALFRLGSLVRRRMNVSNEARPLLRDLRERYATWCASGNAEQLPDTELAQHMKDLFAAARLRPGTSVGRTISSSPACPSSTWYRVFSSGAA